MMGKRSRLCSKENRNAALGLDFVYFRDFYFSVSSNWTTPQTYTTLDNNRWADDRKVHRDGCSFVCRFAIAYSADSLRTSDWRAPRRTGQDRPGLLGFLC